MLQVCAQLRIHPNRYHEGDSGTTRKGPCAPRRRTVLWQRLSCASPPPPCPGNSGARRGARHGEEAPWRREGPAEKVHGAEKGQPPLVECEVVHVQPPRAKRRRVAAPSPQPSPAPPTDSLAPHCRRAVTVASTALARPAPRRHHAVLEGKVAASLLQPPPAHAKEATRSA